MSGWKQYLGDRQTWQHPGSGGHNKVGGDLPCDRLLTRRSRSSLACPSRVSLRGHPIRCHSETEHSGGRRAAKAVRIGGVTGANVEVDHGPRRRLQPPKGSRSQTAQRLSVVQVHT
jgi:hypothetical protein